jgi:hypothetical protein
MSEDSKASDNPTPQTPAPARPSSQSAKPVEAPAPTRRNVVILADGVAAGPRGRIVRLAATDAQKLIDAKSAREATATDIALAPANPSLED